VSEPKKRKYRSKFEKVDRAVEEVLLGADSNLYRSLNETEIVVFEALVDELRQASASGEILDSQLAKTLWRLHYVKKPVSLNTFLSDGYYLGEVHQTTDENPGMWPEWRRTLCRDFDVDSVIHNLVITGSLGIGKTSMMTTLLLYRLYMATCLRNPTHFFNISKGSEIVYVLLSVTKEAVKDTAFGMAMNYMAQSAYFKEQCGFNPELLYSGYRIPILNSLPTGKPSGLKLIAGSRSQHALGRNVVGVGMDEGNFRLEAEPDMSAYELYEAVRTRIANRFQNLVGFLPALCVIASSASDESSFTEKVIKEIEEANEPDKQKVYRHAKYRIKRHELKLIGWWFKVAYGLKNMEPYILEGLYEEDGSKIPVGQERLKENGEPISCTRHEEPVAGASTELVPGDYWEAYRRNARQQLQDQSGISTGGSHRLFASLIDVEWCIEQSKKEGVPDPMNPGVGMFPMSAEDKHNVWDYLDHKKFLTMVASRVQPIRHPYNLRYAHLDLATSTMAGVAICHLVGNQLITGLIRDGEPFEEYRLIVEYDFILTITAGNSKPINLEKVQRFFFWLRDKCGMRFGKITADMYQSEMPLQGLEAKGFDVDKLSVDRDKSVYTAWRMGFEERRIRLCRNFQMLRESEALLEVDKKFDHPPDGCFTGDTRIALIDGTIPTFEELATRYPDGEKFPVYSIGPNGLCVGFGHTPRITKRTEHLVEIMLDNFQIIKCTPDHLFMTICGDWVAAKNLTPSVSIMPLYRSRERKGGWSGYERVWCPIKKSRILTHQIVGNQFFGLQPKGNIFHHKDEVKHNNHPANLEPMNTGKHASAHTSKRHATDPDYVSKLRSGHTLYRNNGGNEKSRENILNLYAIGVLKRGRSKCCVEGCEEISSADGLCGAHYQKMRREKLKALRTSAQTNHTVLSIKHIVCPSDVWDISVDEYHNFALASGVFVHNSKDTTDAAAGAYFNAVNSEEKVMMNSHNNAVIATNQGLERMGAEAPPVEIVLPNTGYDRSKVFVG
jgi:hypothetical protein